MRNLILAAILSFGIFHCGGAEAQTTTADVFQEGKFLNKDLESGVLLDDYFAGATTDSGDSAAAGANKGALQLKTIIKVVINNIKKWLIPIAIIFITYGGFSIFLTRKDEQNIKRQKDQLISVGLGFMTIALSVVAVDSVFFGRTGEVLDTNSNIAQFAKFGFSEVSGLFDFMITFSIAAAVAFLILNAYQLIFSSDEDSSLSDAKMRVVYSLIGIVTLVSAKQVISIISKGGRLQMPNIGGTIELLANWGNKILGFVAVLAFFAIIWAGLRLIGHFADEGAVETSKNIVISAVIGMIVDFSAWAVIYYFTTVSVVV